MLDYSEEAPQVQTLVRPEHLSSLLLLLLNCDTTDSTSTATASEKTHETDVKSSDLFLGPTDESEVSQPTMDTSRNGNGNSGNIECLPPLQKEGQQTKPTSAAVRRASEITPHDVQPAVVAFRFNRHIPEAKGPAS